MITSMENYTFNVREDEGIYIYFTTSSTTMHIRQGDSSIIWDEDRIFEIEDQFMRIIWADDIQVFRG